MFSKRPFRIVVIVSLLTALTAVFAGAYGSERNDRSGKSGIGSPMGVSSPTMGSMPVIAELSVNTAAATPNPTLSPTPCSSGAGILDPSFGSNGVVITAPGNIYDTASAVAIQSDGKIVAAGIKMATTSDFDFALIRYKTDGSLDSTFGNGGVVTTNFGTYDLPSGIAIQPDGRIIVAGEINSRYGVARYNTNGSLDQSFGNGGVAIVWLSSMDDVETIALQPDGKIVTAGDALTDSNARDFAVVRQLPNGELDTTFGTGGIVITTVSEWYDDAYSLAIQSDGKIVVAGSANGTNPPSNEDFAIVRYNSDGSLDASFGETGIVKTALTFSPDIARDVKLQPDGKIVVTGYADYSLLNDNSDIAILRYNTNGSLDSGFGNGGKVLTDITGHADHGFAAQIQPDGKIVVAGDANNDTAIMRYNANGSPDECFGTNGMAINNVGFQDFASSVVIQPNGRIVAAGRGLNAGTGSNAFTISRYLSDGDPAPTPTPTGTFTPTATSTATPPNTSTNTATSTPTNTPTATFTPTSTPTPTPCSSWMSDNTFGTGGSVITSIEPSKNDAVTAMAIQSNGKTVATGYVQNSGVDWDFATTRYNLDGSLDSTFGSGGIVITNFDPFSNSIDIAQDVAILPEGKILIVGTTQSGGGGSRMARYNSDGSLDTTFGLAGLGGFSGMQTYATAVQANGKVVLAGFKVYQGSFTLTRYNADGSFDSSFGSGGIVDTAVGALSNVQDVAIQSDGKIVAVGYSRTSNNSDFAAVRYNSNGSIDSTFGNAGKIIMPIGNSDDVANSVSIQSDGKIVVSGMSQNGSDADIVVVRFNIDGSPDTTFGSGGKTTSPVGNGGNSISFVSTDSILQPDGKILVASSNGFGTGYVFAALRYNTDGSPDATFGSGGKVKALVRGYDIADSVVLQPDGKVVLGGAISIGQGWDFALARLYEGPCGSPTPTFTPTATFTPANTATATPTETPVNGPSLVISQVYGGGGATSGTPTYSNDYIEIKNVSNSVQSLNSLKLQYGYPGGNFGSPFLNKFSLPDVSLAPGQYYLVQVGPVGTVGSPLPVTPDVITTNINMFTGSGKIALATGLFFGDWCGGNSRPCSSIDLSYLVDWVAYGADGNVIPGRGEGQTSVNNTTPLTNTQGGVRKLSGCQDTNNNNNDFDVVTAPIPRNSSSSFTACTTATATSTNTPTATNTPTPVSSPVISGMVVYGNSVEPKYISNVTVTGIGSPTVTTTTEAPGQTAGRYSMTGFGGGSYTVSLSKSTGANGITSNDAARIAQHVAGSNLLTTANQMVAADVSNNGVVSSFDAAQIANYVASGSSAGMAGSWRFFVPPGPTFPVGASPTSRTYSSVTDNIVGEDYVGLLMGEITGNWTPSGARPGYTVKDKDRSATVTVASISTQVGKEVLIPVTVRGIGNKDVISYEFDLRYDPAVSQPFADVVDLTNTVSRGLTAVAKTIEPGHLRVVVYGALPINDDGLLLKLRFTAVGTSGSASAITWERIMFNEGDLPVATAD